MIQKISKAQELKKAIEVLEQKQLEEGKLLRNQFLVVYESLKPHNFLRNAIKELVTDSNMKSTLLDSASGIIFGLLSNKLVVRSSRNPLLRFAGLIVQYGVTNFVSNHSGSIKKIGQYFTDHLAKFFRDHKK